MLVHLTLFRYPRPYFGTPYLTFSTTISFILVHLTLFRYPLPYFGTPYLTFSTTYFFSATYFGTAYLILVHFGTTWCNLTVKTSLQQQRQQNLLTTRPSDARCQVSSKCAILTGHKPYQHRRVWQKQGVLPRA